MRIYLMNKKPFLEKCKNSDNELFDIPEEVVDNNTQLTEWLKDNISSYYRDITDVFSQAGINFICTTEDNCNYEEDFYMCEGTKNFIFEGESLEQHIEKMCFLKANYTNFDVIVYH